MGAARNTALVIGNGDYQFATKLESPHGDAVAMASLLEGLGFDVVPGFDCDFHDFRRRLKDFQNRIDTAGVALFYYSGHGVAELGEANHLLPIDANVLYRDDLGRVTIPLAEVLTSMRAAARVSLLFLDACRDDPFAGVPGEVRSKRLFLPQTGLAPVPKDQLNQALVAFAAEEGEVARDGDGRDLSPFTAALVQHLGSPGREIRSVMTEVRRDVRRVTDDKQTPWTKDALTEDFVLVPGEVAAAAPEPVVVAGEAVAPPPDPVVVPGGGGFVQRKIGAQMFMPSLQAMAAPPVAAALVIGRGPERQLPWLFVFMIVVIGAAVAVLSYARDTVGLCDPLGSGIMRACSQATGNDVADLNARVAAVGDAAAQRLADRFNGTEPSLEAQLQLAETLMALTPPAEFGKLTLGGRDNVMQVLSKIPPEAWLRPEWIDLLAQAHRQFGDPAPFLSGGAQALTSAGFEALAVLKQNIGYVDRDNVTVYFQFAAYPRPEAETFMNRLFAEGNWRIPGVEREVGSVGLNEVRYGDPQMQALALLLAHDLTEMTGKTVSVAEMEPSIPALHLEIWISQ